MPATSPLRREPAPGETPDPWRWARDPAPGGGPQAGGPREPAIKAPWPALLIAAVLVAAYGAQVATGDALAAADRFGFRPAQLTDGRWTGLLTALFVHAGWTHVLLNALAALAFGAPVARRFGVSAAGAAAFALFYLLCGVLGSLGFAAVQPHGRAVLVGASGAIAGLMGAASRMVPPGAPRLAPMTSTPVLAMAGAWIAVNAVFALTGLALASDGAPLAWQAHLAGYAAGLLLIAPALRLCRAPG